jgi:hypothetical protein
MLDVRLGTFWKCGPYVCTVVGAQQNDDGSWAYNLAGAGWRRSTNGLPVEEDGTPWVRCDPNGIPLEPQTPPITD